MRISAKFLIAIAFVTATLTNVLADEFTKGVVKRVDMKKKKVSIIHEEITNLEMPAMTMVFRTIDDEMLAKMKAGDEIEFVAERVKGKLTVTKLK